MRVLIVCDGPVPHEYMNYRGDVLARFLSESQQNQVTVIAPRSTTGRTWLGAVKIVESPVAPRVRRPRDIVRRIWSLLVTLYLVGAVAKRERPDVIRTISTWPTVMAVLSPSSRRCPVVANLSDFYSDLYGGSMLPWASLAKRLTLWGERLCAKADVVIVDTDAQRRAWIRRGISPERCAVIPHGLPRSFPGSYALPETPVYSLKEVKAFASSFDRLVLYVGDISLMDGLDLLIKSIGHLKTDGKNYGLVIVGSGSMNYLSELRRLSRTLQVHGNIFWVEQVPNSQLPHFMVLADILVAPFRLLDTSSTSIPNKVLEYMTVMRPIVATAGSALEAWFGGAIYYFRDGDSADLAKTMDAALASGQTSPNPKDREAVLTTLSWPRLLIRELEVIQAAVAGLDRNLGAMDVVPPEFSDNT